MGITDEMIRDGTATHRNGSGPTLVAVLAPVEDGGVGLETLLEEEEVAVRGGVAGGVEAISTTGDGGETRRHAGVGGEHRGGGERSGREMARAATTSLGRMSASVALVRESSLGVWSLWWTSWRDAGTAITLALPDPRAPIPNARKRNGAARSRTRGTKM